MHYRLTTCDIVCILVRFKLLKSSYAAKGVRAEATSLDYKDFECFAKPTVPLKLADEKWGVTGVQNIERIG
jgi:ABC-type tungstate transport system permease subunit